MFFNFYQVSILGIALVKLLIPIHRVTYCKHFVIMGPILYRGSNPLICLYADNSFTQLTTIYLDEVCPSNHLLNIVFSFSVCACGNVRSAEEAAAIGEASILILCFKSHTT